VTLQTVAVIGSGLMGRGIAYCAAAGGFRTALHDVSAEALERARSRIRTDLDQFTDAEQRILENHGYCVAEQRMRDTVT